MLLRSAWNSRTGSIVHNVEYDVERSTKSLRNAVNIPSCKSIASKPWKGRLAVKEIIQGEVLIVFRSQERA